MMGALAAVSAGCDPGGEVISRPAPGADWVTNFVALGGSMTAGIQADGMTKVYQLQSYPSVLRETMGVRLGSTRDIRHPIVAFPGYSIGLPLEPHGVRYLEALGPLRRSVFEWDDPSLALEINRELMHETFEIDLDYPIAFRNLGIPHATSYDILQGVSADTCFWAEVHALPNPFMDVVLRPDMFEADLGASLTPLEQALGLSPELALLWVGVAETHYWPRRGVEAEAYGPGVFEADLDLIVTRLRADDVRVVLATLPRASSLPVYTRLPWMVVDAAGNPIAHPSGGVVPLLGEDGTTESDLQPGVMALDPETVVLLDAYEEIVFDGLGVPDPILVARIVTDEGVDEATAVGLLDERYPRHGQPLPGTRTLEPGAVERLDATVDAFNAEILDVADDHGVPVVDLTQLFERMATDGATYAGIPVNGSNPITGGFLSVDGFHPSGLGYAIIAQEFAHVLNAELDAGLPLVDLGAVLDADVLVGGLGLAGRTVPGSGGSKGAMAR